MSYPKDETKLKLWKETLAIQLFEGRAPWDVYDNQIQSVVSTYNNFLKDTANFSKIVRELDWHIIKALMWVETGAWIPEWKSQPMQIGNPGDPGLNQILNTKSGRLLLPPEYARLTAAEAIIDPIANIKAGAGYFLWVFAHFGYIDSPPTTQSSVPPAVRKPDAAHMARQRQSPHHYVPKQKIYAITGWKPISLEYVAAHYNGGDGNYLDKLQFAHGVITGIVKLEAPKHPAQPAIKHDHHHHS